MKKIIFFSHNKNKIEEVLKLFHRSSFNILSLNNFPNIKEPKEIGSSFEENARIKSSYGFNNFNVPCFADDSGICISALKNLPGIKSKRFIKENGGIDKTFRLILDKTRKHLDNKAYFKTSISLTINNNNNVFFNGIVKGIIAKTPRGKFGFLYDPIFIPNGHEKTYGEMTLEEKNKISNRSIAIQKLKKYLLQLVG